MQGGRRYDQTPKKEILRCISSFLCLNSIIRKNNYINNPAFVNTSFISKKINTNRGNLHKYKKGRQRLAVCLVQDHGRNDNNRMVSGYQMRTWSKAFISGAG